MGVEGLRLASRVLAILLAALTSPSLLSSGWSRILPVMRLTSKAKGGIPERKDILRLDVLLGFFGAGMQEGLGLILRPARQRG
jgi:hypothetical protein